MPVRRDVRDAGAIDGLGGLPGDVDPVEYDPAARRTAKSDQSLDEFVLSVAGDARDAEDLAGQDLEVDPVDDLAAAIVVDGQAVDT